MCDKNTIKSYNIKDHTTIHCHITAKAAPTSPPVVDASNPSELNVDTANIRQRLINHQLSAIARASGGNPVLTSNENQQEEVPSVPASGANSRRANQLETTTIINIDLSNLLLPLLACLLTSFWYFRINFKHFFSPLSTLILIIFTFIYGLFLINNISATSNLLFNNQLWRRRGQPLNTPVEVAQN